MILIEISKYLQEHEDDIKSGKSTLSLVTEKLIEILKKQPKNNVEKIIHTELSLFENSSKEFLLIAKSESGRVLMNALYEFSESFERHILRKWLQDKLATDFNNDKSN